MERTGQGRPSTAPLSVTAMQLPNELDLTSERRTDSVRQYGHPILLTLSASDRDLCEIEVDVLDPQGQRFAHPHPRPIDHHPDEPILPRQLSEQALDLSRGQHRGQGLGLSSPRNGVDILETQHLPKKKRQGRSGLISALGRKVAFRQMIQEPLNVSHANRLDRDGAHKFQESLDPTTVSLFGLGGVSTRVEYATKAIKGLSGSSVRMESHPPSLIPCSERENVQMGQMLVGPQPSRLQYHLQYFTPFAPEIQEHQLLAIPLKKPHKAGRSRNQACMLSVMGLQGSPVRIRPSRLKPYNHSVVGLKAFLGSTSGRPNEPPSELQKPRDLYGDSLIEHAPFTGCHTCPAAIGDHNEDVAQRGVDQIEANVADQFSGDPIVLDERRYEGPGVEPVAESAL
jgi:hypothetical protein